MTEQPVTPLSGHEATIVWRDGAPEIVCECRDQRASETFAEHFNRLLLASPSEHTHEWFLDTNSGVFCSGCSLTGEPMDEVPEPIPDTPSLREALARLAGMVETVCDGLNAPSAEGAVVVRAQTVLRLIATDARLALTTPAVQEEA